MDYYQSRDYITKACFKLQTLNLNSEKQWEDFLPREETFIINSWAPEKWTLFVVQGVVTYLFLANFDWMEVNSPYGNALGTMQLHLMMVMMMMMVGGKMPLQGLSSYKDELI